MSHLKMFLTQRMVCSPKHQTVRHLKKLFLNIPSTKASCDFLKNPTKMWSKINEYRRQLIANKFSSNKGSLIIDDTFCYKTGKKMAHIFMNFCHVLRKEVLSHVVVTSVYKTPKVSIGYDYRTYIPKEIAKNFKNKYDFAFEMIRDAYLKKLIRRVFFDSWYCQPKFLKRLKPMNLEFFGMFRIGKLKVRSKGKYKLLSKFVDELCDSKFTTRNIKGRKTTYKIRFYREIVFVKKIGYVNLVISQKYNQKKKVYKEPRAYVTNVLSLRAMDVIRTYLSRWDIEVFHKTAKQAYGFEDYQARRAESRNAYFELAFLSDMLHKLKSLGQLRLRQVSVKTPRSVSMEKIGSEDLVLSTLAAQKKGTLDAFIEFCGFDNKRFVNYL